MSKHDTEEKQKLLEFLLTHMFLSGFCSAVNHYREPILLNKEKQEYYKIIGSRGVKSCITTLMLTPLENNKEITVSDMVNQLLNLKAYKFDKKKSLSRRIKGL